MINYNFITIANELYNDSTITNEELVVYALILKNYNKAKQVSIVSINMLKEFMYVSNRNSRLISKIKRAIAGLANKGLIKNIYDIHFNNTIAYEDYSIDIDNNTFFYCEIESIDDNYFCVYEKDIDKIFQYLATTNIDKFAFVRYFIAIQRVINNEKNFGWLTQKSVEELVGYGKTVAKYNQILQDELKLIQYNNNYMTPQKKYISTFFAPYRDENFNKILENIVKEKNLIYTTKVTSNKKRGLKKKMKNTNRKIKESEKDVEILELKRKYKQLQNEYEKLKYKKGRIVDITDEEEFMINQMNEIYFSNVNNIDYEHTDFEELFG